MIVNEGARSDTEGSPAEGPSQASAWRCSNVRRQLRDCAADLVWVESRVLVSGGCRFRIDDVERAPVQKMRPIMGNPKVLFLCTGNSARSQMAEGYLRHVANDRFEAMSAGIEPKALNPLAVEAMQEIGIDISRQRSKDVVTLLGQHVPYVVTVCDNAKERCPIFPGTWKFLHWGFEDPADATGTHEEKLQVFRRVRDEIIAQIDEQFVEGGIQRRA